MRNITISVTGRTELLMHNSRLVNPMDPATKELAAAHAEWKRRTTDEAFEELCRGRVYGRKNPGPKIVKKARTTFKNFVAAALLPGESDINPLTYRGYEPGQPPPRSL